MSVVAAVTFSCRKPITTTPSPTGSEVEDGALMAPRLVLLAQVDSDAV